jgi:hypothetical protein
LLQISLRFAEPGPAGGIGGFYLGLEGRPGFGVDR